MKKLFRSGLILTMLFAAVTVVFSDTPLSQARQNERADTVIIVVDNFGEEPLISQLARELPPGEIADVVRRNLDTGNYSFSEFSQATNSATLPVRPDVAELSSGNAAENAGGIGSSGGRGNGGTDGRGGRPGGGGSAGDTEPVENNCVATLDSQIFAVRGAIFAVRGAGSIEDSDETHGEQVVNVIEAQLEALGMRDQVDIVRLDITSLSTEQLANQLAGALTQFGGRNVIVNMSLAILPCGDIPAMVAAESYMEELLSDEDADQIQSLLNTISEHLQGVREDGLGNDAFLRSTEPGTGPGRIEPNSLVFVAAAGNYGARFSFLPAAWENVLSVSASEDLLDTLLPQGELAEYSNDGQLMVPLLPDSPAGTSFAAPRVSALLAAMTVDGANSLCPNGSLLALNGLDYMNVTADAAFDQTCSAMVPELAGYGVN